MQLDEESARVVLGSLDDDPPIPSTVDVRRAISEGHRRRRLRRIGGYAATSAVTVLMLASAATAAGTWQGTPAAEVGSQASGPPGAASGSPGAIGSPEPAAPTVASPAAVVPAPQPPTKCKIGLLPLPDHRRMALVTGADPTGRFLLGRTYPSPATSGEYHVVVWDRREPTMVPMHGMDQALNDITTTGVAVGTSWGDTSTTAWLYRDGKLSQLPGGDGAEAYAINEANAAVGVRDGKPIRWRSVDQAPVELPLPAGAVGGEARDVDQDGTAVGFVEDGTSEQAYVWLPDGTGHSLGAPTSQARASEVRAAEVRAAEVRAAEVRAYTVRSGWVTGIAGNAAARWDLRTGTAQLFPQFNIRASTANRYGWQVGTDPRGRGTFRSGAGSVVLPDLATHKSGELTNIPTTLSDDGRVIGGQADDRAGVIRAVAWTCA